MKNKTKIVAVRHLNYDLEVKHRGDLYFFKTNDNVKQDDMVFCDTINGLAVCKILCVYSNIDDLLDVKILPKLQDIKYCRKSL